MRNTIIILIVLTVVVIFYGRFFMPAPSPAEQINEQTATQLEGSASDADDVSGAPLEAR